MCSLPAWPSQDGPVHLYYIKILSELFSGKPSAYQAYFSVKHLLPPYAVYYYSLLGLSHVVSLLTADRVVICIYFISFIFGFRYAARAIGPNANVTALLASSLLLNWPLGMGFANYCLSLSFALWAIGLWFRLGTAAELRRRAVFLGLLLLMTLSHPVPLLAVLAFCGLDLLCRFLFARRNGQMVQWHDWLPSGGTLACGALCLLYVKAFTVSHPLQQRTPVKMTFLEQVVRRGKDILTVKNVEIMYGRWWEIETYRFCLGIILLMATYFALLQWRRSRGASLWAPGDSMLLFAVGLLFALLLLPSDLSGAYYFNERLHLLLWVAFLLAGSSWAPTAGKGELASAAARADRVQQKVLFAEVAAISFALVLTVLSLHAADHTLRPFADRDARMAETEVPVRGGLAIILDGGRQRKYSFAGPSWDPYFWDTVALLRQNDGIMENAPWLDSPIISLAARRLLPWASLQPQLANSPLILGIALDQYPVLRQELVSKARLALFSPVPEGEGRLIPAILGEGWTCDPTQGRGYKLCTRTSSLDALPDKVAVVRP